MHTRWEGAVMSGMCMMYTSCQLGSGMSLYTWGLTAGALQDYGQALLHTCIKPKRNEAATGRPQLPM
jgi:hypothetical protein